MCVCMRGCHSLNLLHVEPPIWNPLTTQWPQRCGVFKNRSAALCHVWSRVNVKPHTSCYFLYLASQICLAQGIHCIILILTHCSICLYLSSAQVCCQGSWKNKGKIIQWRLNNNKWTGVVLMKYDSSDVTKKDDKLDLWSCKISCSVCTSFFCHVPHILILALVILNCFHK